MSRPIMINALPEKRPLIMGIINVTPDSFSGDGLLVQWDYIGPAIDIASQMLEQGADMLDIGGESSRPGSAPISVEEEISRVVPVIEAIKKKHPDALMAIDTVKADVAEAALKAGAAIINDISALAGNPRMASVAVAHQCAVVLMHNRARMQDVNLDTKIGGEYRGDENEDILTTVIVDLSKRIVAAKEAGIKDDRIIIDPGIGFGKTLEQNLALLRDMEKLKELGYPVLLGPSRKSFIGRVLDTAIEERLEGTAACVAVAVQQGVDILRVHDVQFMARVARMTAAICKN